MQIRKKVGSSSNIDTTERSETSFLEENTYIPVELFGIIAECERQKCPGEALLLKAKDLCWSLLAMVASCFSDVSALSCLTAWLEITAARFASISLYETQHPLYFLLLTQIWNPESFQRKTRLGSSRVQVCIK